MTSEILNKILDNMIRSVHLLLEIQKTQRKRLDELQERIEGLEAPAVDKAVRDIYDDEYARWSNRLRLQRLKAAQVYRDMDYQSTAEANLQLEEEVDDEST